MKRKQKIKSYQLMHSGEECDGLQSITNEESSDSGEHERRSKKPVELKADENTSWNEDLKTWVRVNPTTNVVYHWSEVTRGFMPVVEDGVIERQILENYVVREEPGEELAKRRDGSKSVLDVIYEQRYRRDRGLDEIVKDDAGTSYVKKKVNHTIYFQGLPSGISEDECVKFFSKAGLIKRDESGKFMIKFYKEQETGQLKGDGVVTFLRHESVSQSFMLLDDVEICPGYPVKITEAMFKITGAVNKKRRKKKSLAHLDASAANKVKKRKNIQYQELSWQEYEQKHVILKNMFKPEYARDDIFFYDKLKDEVLEEAQTFGKVESVKVFENNPDGVVAIKFSDGTAAQKCLDKMHGRLFDGLRIHSEFYDGYSNYHYEEHQEDTKNREQNWVQWLER